MGGKFNCKECGKALTEAEVRTLYAKYFTPEGDMSALNLEYHRVLCEEHLIKRCKKINKIKTLNDFATAENAVTVEGEEFPAYMINPLKCPLDTSPMRFISSRMALTASKPMAVRSLCWNSSQLVISYL